MLKLAVALLAIPAAFLTLSAAAEPARSNARFDTLITNAHVVDGTGSPWYAADVGIRGGRIAAIGKLDHARASRRINADGKTLAPGFIDMLGQSELTILVDPRRRVTFGGRVTAAVRLAWA